MEENKQEVVTENKGINEEELLKKVELAARRGSAKGKVWGIVLQVLPVLIVIGLLAYYVIPKINAMNTAIDSVFSVDKPVENHDMTLENHGIFGYTAADFEEAILGDSSKMKKLEVMKQDVSEATTLTNTGAFNWAIFSKNQLITYHGTVVYTVDLSELKPTDIVMDEENKTIILKIPHVQQEEINIPEEDIQFGDVNKGMLAFGDIKATPEQIAEVQKEARQKMQDKLNSENTIATADRLAKLAVWEIYSPIIKGVSRDYSLEVLVKD